MTALLIQIPGTQNDRDACLELFKEYNVLDVRNYRFSYTMFVITELVAAVGWQPFSVVEAIIIMQLQNLIVTDRTKLMEKMLERLNLKSNRQDP